MRLRRETGDFSLTADLVYGASEYHWPDEPIANLRKGLSGEDFIGCLIRMNDPTDNYDYHVGTITGFSTSAAYYNSRFVLSVNGDITVSDELLYDPETGLIGSNSALEPIDEESEG